jgi:hypothetical protein
MVDFILLTPTLSATAPASPKAPTVGALLPASMQASSRRGSALTMQPIVFITLKTCVDTYGTVTTNKDFPVRPVFVEGWTGKSELSLPAKPFMLRQALHERFSWKYHFGKLFLTEA